MTALAICFAINALSFLAVILSLMSLHLKHTFAARAHNMFDELKQGLAYVREQRSIRALMVLGAATAFFGLPMLTLLPVFARDVFGSGVEGYSVLLSFSGAGAVAGAMVVAWLGHFRHMGSTTLLVQACFGVLIALIAFSPSLSLTYLLLFASGVTLMIVVSCLMSLVQLIAPNEMRGRVMSIYLVAFRGGMPLGSLVSGYAASQSSAPTVIAFNGVALLAVSVYFLMKTKEIRAL
jgi:predicted MFS family arabinose efflux permease